MRRFGVELVMEMIEQTSLSGRKKVFVGKGLRVNGNHCMGPSRKTLNIEGEQELKGKGVSTARPYFHFSGASRVVVHETDAALR